MSRPQKIHPPIKLSFDKVILAVADAKVPVSARAAKKKKPVVKVKREKVPDGEEV